MIGLVGWNWTMASLSSLGAMMDLLQSSPSGVHQISSRERRTLPRHPYHRKTLCQPQAGPQDEVWMMGVSVDISLAGIGFILHRRFDPGTLLSVELERPQGDSWGALQARVMHCTPAAQPADGNWVLGCALVSALSDEELQNWLNGNGK
jgi:hypothetical protein